MKRKLKQHGQQFLQYQDKEQPLLVLTKDKKTTTYDVGNSGSGLGQA
jgi:hypothetical protein